MDTADGAATGWSVCPGCGLALPGGGGELHGRSNASEACWQLYGEVAAYEIANLARLGGLHQLMVDAYGAQHAGRSTPSIGPAFALIGLRLSLDEGWHGPQVRGAHQYLAGMFREWPAFARPSSPAGLTVLDVALADSPDAHEELVRRWAAAVWSNWRAAHDRVAELIEQRLTADVRDRLRARR